MKNQKASILYREAYKKAFAEKGIINTEEIAGQSGDLLLFFKSLGISTKKHNFSFVGKAYGLDKDGEICCLHPFKQVIGLQQAKRIKGQIDLALGIIKQTEKVINQIKDFQDYFSDFLNNVSKPFPEELIYGIKKKGTEPKSDVLPIEEKKQVSVYRETHKGMPISYLQSDGSFHPDLRSRLQEAFRGIGILCTDENQGENGDLSKFLTSIYYNNRNKSFNAIGYCYGFDKHDNLDNWGRSKDEKFLNGCITIEQAIEKRDNIVREWQASYANNTVLPTQPNGRSVSEIFVNEFTHVTSEDLKRVTEKLKSSFLSKENTKEDAQNNTPMLFVYYNSSSNKLKVLSSKKSARLNDYLLSSGWKQTRIIWASDFIERLFNDCDQFEILKRVKDLSISNLEKT